MFGLKQALACVLGAALIVVLFGRSIMHFRVFRLRLRMPLVASLVLVGLFIWIAKNIATCANAWSYPNQLHGWRPVSITKLVSWVLLMIVSVVLVAWVYPPRAPDASEQGAAGSGAPA